jgi:phage terminase Nu1 subunit (DNA packaging protein)
LKTKLSDEFVVPTLAGVQRFFNCSHQTSKEWRNQGMPVRDDGKYDLKAIFDWWLSKGKWRHTSHGKEAIAKARAPLEEQKLEVEVDHKRLKLARDKGELVERELAHATVEEMFHRVRTRLEAIPEELAASMPPEIRAAMVDDARSKIRLILRQMEHWSIEE